MRPRLLALCATAVLAAVGPAHGDPATPPATRPAAATMPPVWPPSPESFPTGSDSPSGIRLNVNLPAVKGERRVVIKASGVRADRPGDAGTKPHFLYLRTVAYFGNGRFLGVHQLFNELGTYLPDEQSTALPPPPAGADEVVVQYQTVTIDRRQWPEAAFAAWFKGTWWHFSTAVPTVDGCGGAGKGGAAVRVSAGPVDRDLAGWLRDGGLKFEPGASTSARLPL